MATASEFVAKAASQIGYTESPANSNHTKYGEWYGMDYEPWCDMFVSWCANEIGALDIVGKYAYCPSHVNYAKSIGCWLDREEKPQPGDVIFFANAGTACHVGIVEERNGTSSVTTIEGNTSTSSNDNGGAVMRRTRTYGTVGSSWYILGFFRPKWAESEDDVSAEDVWNFDLNGTPARYRVQGIDENSYMIDSDKVKQYGGRGVDEGINIATRVAILDANISELRDQLCDTDLSSVADAAGHNINQAHSMEKRLAYVDAYCSRLVEGQAKIQEQVDAIAATVASLNDKIV